MLDTYYSFRAALTSATTLETWLTNKGISITKVKSWIETNGLTTATSGFAKQLDSLGTVNSSQDVVTLSATVGQAKVAFRVAILNWRDSRNDPRNGDGFTMQLFDGLAKRSILASWNSLATQAIYDTGLLLSAQEFSVFYETYLRQCHAITLNAASFRTFMGISGTTWPYQLTDASSKELKCYYFALA